MNKTFWALVLVTLGVAGNGVANADQYHFNGTVTLCTGTCDSFASLAVGTQVTLTYDINTTPGGAWGFADMGDFGGDIFNPAAPVEPFDGTNPTTANPLPLTSAVAPIAASGGGLTTSGTTDAVNELNSGNILNEFIVPPFNSNGAWVIATIGAGGNVQTQVCLFFTTAGCIPGATQAVVIEGQFNNILEFDDDADGVLDDEDNCTNVANPSQIDTDGDLIGNACDPDIALPNDCVVNFLDLGAMKSVFFTNDPDADLVGPGDSESDGVVNFLDLGKMKAMFFGPPGPSADGCN
jgi:hypothetical protein